MHRQLLPIGAVFLFAFQGELVAAESPADLDAYCRAVHGDRAFQTIDRRDSGFFCTIGIDPGPGMTHYKMLPADACAAQFGSELFRREGDNIICTGANDGQVDEGTLQIDLAAYCFSEYGENAEVTRNNITGASMCTVRTDGGLGMLHNVIDVASLCPAGSNAGPVTGTTLTCLGGNGDDPGTTSAESVKGTNSGDETVQSGNRPSQDMDPVEVGEPYFGKVITGETWQGIEGEASFFPWLDLRIEALGDEIKAFVSSRYNRKCLDIKNANDRFKLGLDCLDDTLGIVAETLVLVGRIEDNGIVGKTRLTMMAVPFPVCEEKWRQLDDNPSLWLDYSGKIDGDQVQLQLESQKPRVFQPWPKMPSGEYVCSQENYILEAGWDREGPATFIDNLPANINKLPPLEFVNTIRFQRLNDGPNVVEVVFVDSESPFLETEIVSQGQKLRVRVILDSDAAGQSIRVTAGTANDVQMELEAVCGELTSDRNVCFTDAFLVAD